MKRLLQKILAHLARTIVQKYRPDVIAITGSVGKTTAKEAVVRVLSETFNVRGSEKSYNNELGVPLTIIGAHAPARSLAGWLHIFFRACRLLCFNDPTYPAILVLEMGSDAPGDIERLVAIAPPKIGVITAISPAHLEKLGTMDNLIAEKKSIFCKHISADQWMILNADDSALYPVSQQTPACLMTFGEHPESVLRISDVTERYVFHPDQSEYVTGIACTLTYEGRSVRAEFPHLIGRHVLPSIIAGVTVGCIYHIPLTEIVRRLHGIEPARGRLRPLLGIKHTLIIDDTYNSSPKAARGAIDTLMSFEIDGGARRIALLGDMRELGSHTEKEHRALGTYAAQQGIDYLFAIGNAAHFLAEGALESIDQSRVFVFNDSVSAGRALQELMRKGDVILIKGSQNMIRLERVVKEVMAEPHRANELLVRQDREWM
ncbi:UDP-N-acetylmuramoyl-tripeptide--D-alanyl-D-alanine ligase [Candidatus Uhrbacteria bacterium]|nr:UDP-N-acetylmuramoyl-tripeptide--D-alanyl-D-alanine ligase [Candidatus Uhrbacteria bacterium]